MLSLDSKISRPQFLYGVIDATIGSLLLQEFEKAFAAVIVKWITLFLKGLHNIAGIQKLSKEKTVYSDP